MPAFGRGRKAGAAFRTAGGLYGRGLRQCTFPVWPLRLPLSRAAGDSAGGEISFRRSSAAIMTPACEPRSACRAEAARRLRPIRVEGACRRQRSRRNLDRRFGRGGDRVDGMFYDALEARDPAEREAALMAALPRAIAAAKENAPAYRERLAKIRPEDVTDRRALVDLPLTRKSDLIEMQRQQPALRRAGGGAGHRGGAGFRLARPDLRAGGAPAGFLPHGARTVCRRHPSRRSRPQQFFVSPDPGRRDGRERGAGVGLPGDPGRHRADRTAASHDRRSASGRLCRDAVIPENPDRPRRRARASISARCGTRWSAPRRFRRRCGPSSATAASPRCNATAPPISA